ncbi:MAG TPA: GDSL-type esterase/lipase family protein [Dehalococcoidia bacterium]|nr:GDSL-type esterase/lipase family protein [Dehalococcoidia bacterium]
MGKLLTPLLAALLSLALLAGQARAEETPAYVALGDSLAFGVGASDPGTHGYVGLVFDALRTSDRYRERGLGLVNLSAPGATSADLLLHGSQLDSAVQEIIRRQEDTSSADDNVEIISIDIGGNDLLDLASGDSPCRADLTSGPCGERFAQMLGALRSNLKEVVGKLRQAAPKADIIIVGLYNPYSGTGSSLETPADLAVQQINGALAGVAADTSVGAKWAPVFDFFRGRGAQWIAADGLHPNDKGHAVIAEALLAAIQDREPALPEDLVSEPPAPTGGSSGPAPPVADTHSNDGNLLLLLAVAVPAAFLSGGIITGAYFIARGRR